MHRCDTQPLLYCKRLGVSIAERFPLLATLLHYPRIDRCFPAVTYKPQRGLNLRSNQSSSTFKGCLCQFRLFNAHWPEPVGNVQTHGKLWHIRRSNLDKKKRYERWPAQGACVCARVCHVRQFVDVKNVANEELILTIKCSFFTLF